MKKIEAIIKPFKLNEVRKAILDIGIHGLTVIEVKGIGRQKGHAELYSGDDFMVDLIPKVKIEVVVEDDICEQCIDVILDTANTGKIGDGKIFVSSIERVIRVRTREENAAAL